MITLLCDHHGVPLAEPPMAGARADAKPEVCAEAEAEVCAEAEPDVRVGAELQETSRPAVARNPPIAASRLLLVLMVL